MPSKQPYYMTDLLVAIGTAPAEVELQCFATNFDHKVDQDENTNTTFCDSFVSYGKERHTLTITVLQSFGADGFWNQVQPLVGTIVPFRVLPDGGVAVSADNPEMTGTAMVRAFPFLSGAANEVSDFDLELAVQGQPTFNAVGP